jgi:hypothetical protein
VKLSGQAAIQMTASGAAVFDYEQWPFRRINTDYGAHHGN